MFDLRSSLLGLIGTLIDCFLGTCLDLMPSCLCRFLGTASSVFGCFFGGMAGILHVLAGRLGKRGQREPGKEDYSEC